MNITQAKRPKTGHAAKPPPRRDIIAYANTGTRKPMIFRNSNRKQLPHGQAARKEIFL